MKDRSYVKHHRRVGTPVSGELDLVGPTLWIGRVARRPRRAQEQTGEGVGAHRDGDRVALTGECVDYRINGGREVAATPPVGEQIDVAAGALTHTVLAHRVSAGQR